MAWTLRQYALPLLLALLLHALAAVFLVRGFDPSSSETRTIKPQIVNSQLLVLEPKARPAPPPRAEPAPQPDRARERAEQQAREQQAREQAAREAEQRRQEQARQKAEAERQRQEAEAQQRRLEALANASFADALADESEALAEAEADAAEQVAQSFRYGIYEKVVANWSRPPSARNRMEAKLLVELVPTGDVVAVTVLDSSGSEAFDRSAEAAVRKAGRFEVPDDSSVFERYFRRFTLLFRPEDLLR